MIELLNVTEAATCLKVSQRTIRKYIADGDLVCVRLGDRVLIRPEDLTEFVRKNLTRARADHPAGRSVDKAA